MKTELTLVDALRIGEAACLSMMVFEPISLNQVRWEMAAQEIARHRKLVEAEASRDVTVCLPD